MLPLLLTKILLNCQQNIKKLSQLSGIASCASRGDIELIQDLVSVADKVKYYVPSLNIDVI